MLPSWRSELPLGRLLPLAQAPESALAQQLIQGGRPEMTEDLVLAALCNISPTLHYLKCRGRW